MKSLKIAVFHMGKLAVDFDVVLLVFFAKAKVYAFMKECIIRIMVERLKKSTEILKL